MKTIERLLQEYKIRFRDTELIKRDGYPFSIHQGIHIHDFNQGSMTEVIGRDVIINKNGKVYEDGIWATADLKEKPDEWVVEKDESHPMWEMFKAWYLGKYAFLCDLDFNEYRFFAVQFYDEEITAFERHQYLTLDQWAEFFLNEPKVGDWGIFYDHNQVLDKEKAVEYLAVLGGIKCDGRYSIQGFTGGWDNFYKIDPDKSLRPQIDEFLKQQTK